ncbi:MULTISPECIES: ABC-type transport auxiliary lipoprotein family protein [Paraburkholderia]|jgi:cholesterol transport system auxiliary component|uniref:ABC-type transport auxiliary lipoprotein component domain-containing protein n=2 Tax=Paraburkholderia TaxID=1822464 RepID=A0ABN7KYL6_9BURK|nr:MULTISPECIES: ABC-type transport auxiliary lipoprotein family protein [Paraburkholderia]KPD18411.1 ABC transporter [Burkholderia sp. ST111]MBK5150329.1 membrane integrity-associated transporter subunit PqiC [Burkholderia sp. R-69608]MBK3740223.1 ABC transporter [Paraburkholderia aspalathi]MBK3780822.1 ABC transporter [Paraburkholderia aspalathi]MBK3814415.1 ABC transporter [Paraburkholderia aspalathi]
MSRLTHRLLSSGATLAMLLAFGVLAAGCAGTPAAISDIRYDLGPPNPAASAGTLPAVKVLDVTAPDNLESDKLIYRLSYADAQQTASYANSHWTMAPSQLLTQRLRGALSSRGTVLTGADGVHAPVLKVDLSEFEQVFDSQSESHAAVTARATLTQNGKVIGQRTFLARAPSSSGDAAGGAQALAAASDDLVAQIGAWLGVQALVAAQ